MTFSFGLIWAVLLLAPGLAAHAALFAGRDGAVIRATPPAPNSFGTIGIVVDAAAALHLVWATLAIALAQPCRIGFCPAAFAIDPDPYALAIALVAKAHPLTAHALVYLMAQAATLTIVGFVGVRRAMHTAWVRDRNERLSLWPSRGPRRRDRASVAACDRRVRPYPDRGGQSYRRL